MTDAEFVALEELKTELLVNALQHPGDDYITRLWLDARDRYDAELERRIEASRQASLKDK